MRKNQTVAAARGPFLDRRGWLLAGGAATLLLAGAGSALYLLARHGDPAARPELAGSHAPTLGDAGARVRVVEFIDPACETCAAFYPIVKQLLADNPGRIRLVMRHVTFHPGVGDVVRMLEASRAQDAYWKSLEALLVAQDGWVVNHRAQPEAAAKVLAATGLDMTRLAADMRAPEVTERMQRDMADAQALDVSKTPEYFVNGRQMPSFGRQQLITLVRDELRRAY